MITRAAPRLDPPVPAQQGGATTTTLHQATGSPAVIGLAPATSSADRSSPSEPARTGHTSADTGTATTTAWAAT